MSFIVIDLMTVAPLISPNIRTPYSNFGPSRRPPPPVFCPETSLTGRTFLVGPGPNADAQVPPPSCVDVPCIDAVVGGIGSQGLWCPLLLSFSCEEEAGFDGDAARIVFACLPPGVVLHELFSIDIGGAFPFPSVR